MQRNDIKKRKKPVIVSHFLFFYSRFNGTKILDVFRIDDFTIGSLDTFVISCRHDDSVEVRNFELPKVMSMLNGIELRQNYAFVFI